MPLYIMAIRCGGDGGDVKHPRQLQECVQHNACGKLHQRHHLGRAGRLRPAYAPHHSAGGSARARSGCQPRVPRPGAGFHALRRPPCRFYGEL